MRILVGIPVLYHAEQFKRALRSVIKVDVLVVDNGSDKDVKNVINQFPVHVIRHEVNTFVNSAWNDILNYFINSDKHTHLIIMNSDLQMQTQWKTVLENRLAVNPNDVCLPVLSDINVKVEVDVKEPVYVTEGIAGIFILLNKEQARLVYPIPSEIKVWFGDNWIFERLKKHGYKICIPPNLIAQHEWSSTVSRVGGISEIIEQDKLNWETIKHQI